MKIKLKWWWYILPAYLTLWTIAFSLWNLMDGNGMMEAFGVDTGGASPFIMLNSAGRYVSIAVAMVLGIWVFSTFHSILLALLVRLTMDVLDLGIGLQTGLVEGAGGVIQSLLMFIVPNIISLFFLFRLNKVLTEN